MKYVTTHTTYIIRVPKKLWPAVRRAILDALGEGHSDHGTRICTDTKSFAISFILQNIPLPPLKPWEQVMKWTQEIVRELPANYTGDLEFICEP
jgi:hypothetical protein